MHGDEGYMVMMGGGLHGDKVGVHVGDGGYVVMRGYRVLRGDA